jgi:RNA polymerase sigma-70 factor (ECF subfamily)
MAAMSWTAPLSPPISARAGLVAAGDPALVELARGGDDDAVRVLVRRHNQRLFRVARAILRSDAEAEDAVQASYVKAFTHLDGFRGEAQFTTWLTRITANEALGRRRQQRPTTDLEAIEAAQASGSAEIIQFPLLQPQSDPETDMAREEIRQLLEQAVDALPEGFRAVVVLRDVEGLSAEETAAHLSLKPATVNTRLHRARRMLREAIAARLAPAFSALFPFDGQRCVNMAERVVTALHSARLPG